MNKLKIKTHGQNKDISGWKSLCNEFSYSGYFNFFWRLSHFISQGNLFLLSRFSFSKKELLIKTMCNKITVQ